MVRPERFELPTYCSGGNRSIQLSYGRAQFSLHASALAINHRKSGYSEVTSLKRESLLSRDVFEAAACLQNRYSKNESATSG